MKKLQAKYGALYKHLHVSGRLRAAKYRPEKNPYCTVKSKHRNSGLFESVQLSKVT